MRWWWFTPVFVGIVWWLAPSICSQPAGVAPAPSPAVHRTASAPVLPQGALGPTDTLGLDPRERAAVAEDLAELARGRSALFDQLAHKQITAEDVSRGLHELRATLAVHLESTLGHERARQLQLALRDAHRKE